MAPILKDDLTPDIYIPTEIYIQKDIIPNIGYIIKKYGSKVILITTANDFVANSSIIETIYKNLKDLDIGCIVYDEISDIPDTEYVDSAVYFTKKTNCDTIIGLGGIESINVAKAVAILTNNSLFCEDLFNYPDVQPPVMLITIPTHPIFGFEILPMFYLTEIHEMTKKVYRNSLLFPKATIIDYNIANIPDEETIANNMISALAMSTESVISKKSNPFINTYALKSIDLIFKNLPKAYIDPKNPSPWNPLSIASIMSGFAFSASELSLSLAISLALSSRSDITVERGMGVILPHVMEYNLTASSSKYVQMSKVMDESIKDITVIEAAIKAIEGVRKLEIDINITQRLSQFDIQKIELSRVAEIANSYHFIENAPRPLSRDEIETILIAAY